MTGEIASNRIQEYQQPLLVWMAARVIAIAAHPLFIPLYITGFLLFVHPLMFAGYERVAKLKLLATVFVNLVMLPGITVFLCWRLKFIESIHLKTQKERIIPLAAAMIFYFWCWFVLRNFSEIPVLFRQFLLGSFITLIMAWMANIYFKVSLHALAVGGLFYFTALVVFGFEGGSAGYLAVAVIISGLVCTSRLITHAHRPFEVYAGFILGVFSQILAVWFN